VNLLSSKLREIPLVFLDLETTGLNPEEGHEILEFGAVRTVAGEEQAQMSTLIRPNRPIPPESVKVHGITDLFVMGAPSFDMAAPDILEFIGDGVVIAHNAPFDVSFLAVTLERLGTKLPENPVMDTVVLSRALLPGIQNHKLDTLKNMFSVKAERSHRALDDSRALSRVFAKLVETHFHALDGGPTLAEVSAKAAPLYRFNDFAQGIPLKSGELRALVRWAIREKRELHLSYSVVGKLLPEEARVMPVDVSGKPPVLKALAQPSGAELSIPVDKIRTIRRAL
jgi:DNA polymerase III epsilon subunit